MSRAGEVYENAVTSKRAVVPVEIEIELTKYPRGVYSSRRLNRA